MERSVTPRFPANERRALVLEAGAEIFARDGFAAARLEDIAAAAGVTKPIVYRHFGSKKELYLALLKRHHDDLPTFVEPLPGDAAPPGVGVILAGWLAYASERRLGWELIFRDASGDEEIRAYRRKVNRRALEVMTGFIGRVAGDRIPDQQIEPTAAVITNGLAGMILWWNDHPEAPMEMLYEAAARIVLPLTGP